MKLSSSTQRKFIETYPGNGRKVLTPHGYKEIIEVHKTIPYRKFKITLDNGMFLDGAYNHVIIDENKNEVYIKDSLHRRIITEKGISEVIQVQDLSIEENMYDISIDSEDELYYSNGILSHNSGKTVTTSSFLLWNAIFRDNINIGIFANVMKLAKEVLDKIKKIFVQMPIWLQIGLESWNKESLEFENGTRIMTAATNGDAFRGFSIDLLYGDEVAFSRANLWEELKDSVFPAQDALAVHQTILSSTPKGYNQWYYLVKGAREGKNGYLITECDWKEVPRWNRNGSKKSPEQFEKETIASKGNLYFNQNFKGLFLGSADTMISTQALENIKPQEPVHNKYINGLRVYNTPQEGHNYIVSVDPAKDGIDDFSLHVIDVTTLPFIQVAAANLQVDYLSMAQELNSLGETYNNAFMIIENNEGAGQSINDTLWNTFEYDNLYKDRQPEDPRKYKKYKGFRTTTKSRGLILNMLKIFLENDNLVIQDENTLYELQNFIKQDNGKYAADVGFKDDLVMSLCISFAPLMTVKGFENQKAFLNEMFKKEEVQEKSGFDELFAFGSFEDSTNYEELDDFHQSVLDARNKLNSSGEMILEEI